MQLETTWKDDLPEGFDPMTAKELRQGMRRGSFVIPFLGIQLLALAAMITEFRSGQARGSSEFTGILNVSLLWTSGPFWMVVGAVCMVLMPLGGVVLMAEELEDGNHELLLLTKLRRWKVVLGKFSMLWGLSVITFISLLPYVVVRYLVGGIEWWHEAACAGTVICGSAMIGAGAIAASAFRGMGARVSVLLLFYASMAFGAGIPVFAAAQRLSGCGWLYHITAMAAVGCYTAMGLAVARSRLRVAVMAYEVKPGGMLIGLLVFSPFVIGLITAFTIGFGGAIGLGLITLVAIRMDITPGIIPAPVDY